MWQINTDNNKASVFTDANEDNNWTNPFFFVQGADTQFALTSRLNKETINWDIEKKFAENLIAKINKMEPPPKFFIICGDLLDAYQGDKNRRPQEQDFKTIFGKVKADVPVFCVCGNHDVNDRPSPDTIKGYRDVFGDDYYSFTANGILFIVINSQYFYDSSDVPQMAMDHSTWLDDLLDRARKDNRRAIVFQHIPWFIEQPDEPGNGFTNLSEALRQKWLPKFKAAGVEAVFCGHLHRNTGGDFEEMPVITTSAIGFQVNDDKPGARIVTVLADEIRHQYYSIDEFPVKNMDLDARNWKINTRNHRATAFIEDVEKNWSQPFFFVLSADCQFGLISRYLDHDEVVTWEKEKALCEAIVARVNMMEPPPKFFVICGDLVDAQQHKADRRPQERDFKSIFGKVRPDVPLLCVCGNHDVDDRPSPKTIQGYRAVFGDDFYSFMVSGVLFIVINSQYFFDSSDVPQLAAEHAEWLDSLLVKMHNENIKRAVVFQHIPWFLQKSDEPADGYFNLSEQLRQEWLPKMQRAGVEAVFCGHYHRNAGGEFNGMPVVVTSAIGAQLGNDKSGARIVTVLEQTIKHKYYAIDELPLKNI